MKNNKTILMTSARYTNGEIEKAILEPMGVQVRHVDCPKEEDIIENGQDALGIIITISPFGQKAIAALPKLKIIVRAGIGLDNIDVSAALKNNILVCNVPDYCINEVADHAMAMLLALERKLIRQNNIMRSGKWMGAKGAKPINGLQGSTLGLIGFGAIGHNMACRARGFKLSVIACDPFVDSAEAKKHGVDIVSFDELLANSDFISLHAPLTEETFHVINSDSINKMKPNACIINTARGALIDTDALLEALANKGIAGAGLDVFEEENMEGVNKFLEFENVIITPHTSYYSESSLHQLKTEPAYEIARFLKGEPLRCPVNYKPLIKSLK